MNDRASQKPPSVYIRDEEAMDWYMTPTGAADRGRNRDIGIVDVDSSHLAGISSSKHSSMFRFGKAVVNAFNPANVWQGFNGMWKETEEVKPPEKDSLQERQVKAEKAYAELKKSGFKGTKASPELRVSEDIPTLRYNDIAEVPQETAFRDSGIDMDGYRSSTEHGKDNQTITPAEGLMPPPPARGSGRSPSPMGIIGSTRRSSLTLHKPSFQSLKKVQSHFHLSPTKRGQSEVSLPLSSIEMDIKLDTNTTVQQLRSSPSKKELVKQQKLTKKVSDLETKLDKARRELEGLQEPSKLGLKPFKPGALPSLPSERVLNSHGISNNPEGARSFVNSNTTKQSGTRQECDMTPQANIQLQNELKSSVSRGSLSRKRKSSDALYRPGRDEDTGDSDFHAARKTAPNVSSVRSRKSQMIEGTVTVEPVKAKHHRNITPNGPRRISSRKTVDPLPPLPATSKVVDTTQVDQAKLLSMRSVPNDKVPFGKISSDILNLRALYPSLTEAQITDYVGKISEDKKKTDHKSLSHQDRPASPFLPPPLSASPPKNRAPPPLVVSPIRTRAKKAKRGISPPPPSMISPKRPASRTECQEDDDTATINSEVHDTVAPLPETLSKTKENVINDKPLPSIQKEDYEWPEDVF